MTNKIGLLVIESENQNKKKQIINRLISFYINIIDFTLLQPNSSAILNNIWFSIERMYGLLIEKKSYSYELKEFREGFFERYFNRLFEGNKEEVIFTGIEALRNIVYNQMVANMSDDIELYDLNHMRAEIEKDFKYPNEFEDESHKRSEHFGEVTIHFLYCFSFIMDKAIKYKKQEILNKCAEELNRLNSDVERNGRKQKYQEAFLYLKCSEMISDYSFRAFKEDVYSTGSEASELLPVLFSHDIEQGKLYARGVLQKYCHLLIRLQEIDKLDRWFLGGLDFGIFVSEGKMGELARRCIVNYKKNKTVQECLLDIVDTYKILKDRYEVGKVRRFDLYMAVKARLETINDLLLKHDVADNGLSNSIKEILEHFKTEEEYEISSGRIL